MPVCQCLSPMLYHQKTPLFMVQTKWDGQAVRFMHLPTHATCRTAGKAGGHSSFPFIFLVSFFLLLFSFFVILLPYFHSLPFSKQLPWRAPSVQCAITHRSSQISSSASEGLPALRAAVSSRLRCVVGSPNYRGAVQGQRVAQQTETLWLGRLERGRPRAGRAQSWGRGVARFSLQQVRGSGRAAAPSPESAELERHRDAGLRQMSRLNGSCSTELTFGADLNALAKTRCQIEPGGGHGWVHHRTPRGAFATAG